MLCHGGNASKVWTISCQGGRLRWKGSFWKMLLAPPIQPTVLHPSCIQGQPGLWEIHAQGSHAHICLILMATKWDQRDSAFGSILQIRRLRPSSVKLLAQNSQLAIVIAS